MYIITEQELQYEKPDMTHWKALGGKIRTTHTYRLPTRKAKKQHVIRIKANIEMWEWLGGTRDFKKETRREYKRSRRRILRDNKRKMKNKSTEKSPKEMRLVTLRRTKTIITAGMNTRTMKEKPIRRLRKVTRNGRRKYTKGKRTILTLRAQLDLTYARLNEAYAHKKMRSQPHNKKTQGSETSIMSKLIHGYEIAFIELKAKVKRCNFICDT